MILPLATSQKKRLFISVYHSPMQNCSIQHAKQKKEKKKKRRGFVDLLCQFPARYITHPHFYLQTFKIFRIAFT